MSVMLMLIPLGNGKDDVQGAGPLGMHEGHDRGVMGEDVRFGHSKVEIEHVQEFTFYSPDVAGSEDTRAHCPVNVLQGGVIQVLIAAQCIISNHTMKLEMAEHTLLARITPPRNTRSKAYWSIAISRWDLALSI